MAREPVSMAEIAAALLQNPEDGIVVAEDLGYRLSEHTYIVPGEEVKVLVSLQVIERV